MDMPETNSTWLCDAKLMALMTDDRLGDEIAWIKAEVAALDRDSAPCWAPYGSQLRILH